MMGSETVVGATRGVLAPGTRLSGIYEVEALIATGGMGEVYRAHAVETGDKVAVKMIRWELAANETFVALFRKEAAALFKLHNDAIIRYYVSATDPVLNRLYLAMELIEGESLTAAMARGPLSSDAILKLLERLAGGLAAAHDLGVVHRDIAPDNIYLPDGDPAKAKIIDFGVARSAFGGDSVIGASFAGKLNFVSPEQVGLFDGQVTNRSDMYSLGLTLAAAASGSPIDMGGTHLSMVQKRQVVPNLSGIEPRLRPLLERLLQPEPKDRPASMHEVTGWVRDLRPRNKGGSAPNTRRGAAGWIAGGLALALVALGAGAFVLKPWQQGRPTTTAAVALPIEAPPAHAVTPPAPPVPDQPPVTPRIAEPPPTAPAAATPPPVAEVPPPPVEPQAKPPSQAPDADGAGAATPGASVSVAEAPVAPEPPQTPTIPSPTPSPPAAAEAPPAPPATVPAPATVLTTAPGAFRDCPTCPEMIVIGTGTLQMGSLADPSERPVHKVTLNTGFAIGRAPVTVADWERCVAATACHGDLTDDPAAFAHNLSFDDATDYATWLARVTGLPYRLPTEAEWEFAARAGTSTLYWWGNDFRPALSPCRTCGDPAGRPPGTARFQPNPFGLVGVTGAVAQWVADCWHKNYTKAPADGSAWLAPACPTRVLRGGSWTSGQDELRVTNRDFYDAAVRYPGHGFRVARNL